LAGLSQIRKGTANPGSGREPAAAWEEADENPMGLKTGKYHQNLILIFD
jgi:hypothetical protein